MNGIERHQGGTTFTGEGIALFRLTTFLRGLKLEMKGIKMTRRSIYAQVKREFGFRGGKQAVYDQLLAFMQYKLQENAATSADVDSLVDATRIV